MLPTVRSSGDLSRDSADYVDDVLVEDHEVLQSKCLELQAQVDDLGKKLKAVEQERDATKSWLAEMERARQREQTFLGPSASTASNDTTSAPATPGGPLTSPATSTVHTPAASQPSASPAQAQTLTSPADAAAHLQYLKNAIVAYLSSTAASEHKRMLPAIVMLLKLSKAEEARIQTAIGKEAERDTAATTGGGLGGLLGGLWG
jgi:hypothetical protein